MTNTTTNCVVCGVGGQGTVLAAKLLAQCALDGGAFVRGAETIGMAQRGGSVLGHVRISDPEGAPLLSPLVPPGGAQLLIGFEPAETLRAYRFCNAKTLVITATKPLPPPTASLERLSYDGSGQLAALRQAATEGRIAQLTVVDNEVVMSQLGFDKALNVVLLGAALQALEASSFGGQQGSALTYSAMQNTIKNVVKQRFVETNLRALEMGYTLLWK